MKGIAWFAAGVVVGAVLLETGAAENRLVRGVNHIGISVANYDEALEFYKGTLGIREAYTVRNPDGSVLLTYLQPSRETFIELIPAAPGQPTGVTHFGIEVGNIDAAVAALRARGIVVADPGLTPAKARYTRAADRDGVQIEVMEFGPESSQRKAMDAWE